MNNKQNSEMIEMLRFNSHKAVMDYCLKNNISGREYMEMPISKFSKGFKIVKMKKRNKDYDPFKNINS